MNARTVVRNFGFHIEEEPISIYPFSPVYRVEEKFIVKKTQNPLSKAARLMAYTRSLKDHGINVVTPANVATQNPQTIDDATYVVYPFIEGEPYSARDEEIKEAGRLLGRIHSLSPAENDFQLDPYDVYDFNEGEVQESYTNIKGHAKRFEMEVPTELKVKLLLAVDFQEELKQAGLPAVATPHDFKANNLIYVPGPYLIDPDNACWIPRIFDLALALLLFHNELATAPDQPFTPNQWQLFLEGYAESIELTSEERAYWSKAVEHVFLDEVMWLMADVEEDWQNPAQRNLFNGLIELLLELEGYGLDMEVEI